MKKKILLVDDEPDLKFLFKEGLEHAGLCVDAFNNSAEVLKDLKPHLYDLVILDIVMPDSFDLYKELKKQDPDVKVCFLTASQKYHEDFRGREHGDLSQDLFIEKPISIKDLIREIHERIGPI